MMLKINVQDSFKIMQFSHVNNNCKMNASYLYCFTWCSEVSTEVVSGGKRCSISSLNTIILYRFGLFVFNYSLISIDLLSEVVLLL